MAAKRYRIGEIAQLAGISVRALHHYDEIGLLCPKARSGAGYRLYDMEDLLRLQQIMIRRELGLTLEQIRATIDASDFTLKRALERQRAELQARRLETTRMIEAIDAALFTLDNRTTQEKPMDPKSLFDGFDPSLHAAEAKQRWGGTPAYAESSRRTRTYGAEQWAQIRGENDEIMAALAREQAASVPASSVTSMDLAQRHRLHIERWFYPCSSAIHCGLADMYEADSRFATNIDKHGAGLTPYLSAAIRANAARET